MRGLITAFRTLTLIPVFGKDAANLSSSLPWFPVVGLVLGLLLLGLGYLVGLAPTGWPEGVAAMVLVGSSFLTRGIHLDGIADMADGFGGGRDKEKILLIMKDSNVGAFAAITLILLFLVKFVAISRIVEAEQLALIVPAFVLSRFAMVNMAVSLPYARQEGTGGAFVKGASLLHSVIAGVISLLIVAAFMQWQGLLILVLTLIVSFLLGLYFKKKIGGVTGDLLGATSEVIESLVLFATALFVNVL